MNQRKKTQKESNTNKATADHGREDFHGQSSRSTRSTDNQVVLENQVVVHETDLEYIQDSVNNLELRQLSMFCFVT